MDAINKGGPATATEVNGKIEGAFTASLRNSMVVAGLGAILALVIGIPAAWAVSRMPRPRVALSMAS